MSRLDGKVALITGGTSGIGAATAKLLRAEGAVVVATGSSDRSVEAARNQMRDVEFIVSDAGSADAAKVLIEHVHDRYGRVDVLFVNAGVSRFAPLEQVDEMTFDRLLNLLFRGPYFLLKHAAAVMPDGGSIILTSSVAAVRGLPEQSVYSACKAALRSLGLSLAVELAPRDIRVNTVTPGPIRTSIGAKMELTPEQASRIDEITARVPLRRMGEPDEIAAAVLYFASEEAKFTTGAELTIDGGMTAT